MTERKLDSSVDLGPSAPSGDTAREKVDHDLAELLNHLLHLGYDLVGAYEMAIDRIGVPEFADSLNHLAIAHRRQIDLLAERVRALGHRPTTRGDFRSVLEKGRVVIAGLRGDTAILEAMEENEKALHDGYRQALKNPGLNPGTRHIIENALAEEDRHQAVYDSILESRRK